MNYLSTIIAKSKTLVPQKQDFSPEKQMIKYFEKSKTKKDINYMKNTRLLTPILDTKRESSADQIQITSISNIQIDQAETDKQVEKDKNQIVWKIQEIVTKVKEQKVIGENKRIWYSKQKGKIDNNQEDDEPQKKSEEEIQKELKREQKKQQLDKYMKMIERLSVVKYQPNNKQNKKTNKKLLENKWKSINMDKLNQISIDSSIKFQYTGTQSLDIAKQSSVVQSELHHTQSISSLHLTKQKLDGIMKDCNQLQNGVVNT